MTSIIRFRTCDHLTLARMKMLTTDRAKRRRHCNGELPLRGGRSLKSKRRGKFKNMQLLYSKLPKIQHFVAHCTSPSLYDEQLDQRAAVHEHFYIVGRAASR